MSDEGNCGAFRDEKIERLERRVSEMEALMKGLTDEMLDMKAVVMKMKKDQRPAPVIQAVSPPAPSRNKAARSDEPESSVLPPVQPPREKVTLKMQPDGTLAPAREIGDDIIIASARDARSKGGKDTNGRSRSDLIIAEDAEQTEQK